MRRSPSRTVERWLRRHRKTVALGVLTVFATLATVMALSFISGLNLRQPAGAPSEGGLAVFGWTPEEQENFARASPAERVQMQNDRAARGDAPPAAAP